MDEKDMSQIFSEAMRLYAERIRQNQSLGPFKKILAGEVAVVQVSLSNATLVVNEVIEAPKPPLEVPLPKESQSEVKKPLRKHTE